MNFIFHVHVHVMGIFHCLYIMSCGIYILNCNRLCTLYIEAIGKLENMNDETFSQKLVIKPAEEIKPMPTVAVCMCSCIENALGVFMGRSMDLSWVCLALCFGKWCIMPSWVIDSMSILVQDSLERSFGMHDEVRAMPFSEHWLQGIPKCISKGVPDPPRVGVSVFYHLIGYHPCSCNQSPAMSSMTIFICSPQKSQLGACEPHGVCNTEAEHFDREKKCSVMVTQWAGCTEFIFCGQIFRTLDFPWVPSTCAWIIYTTPILWMVFHSLIHTSRW